jgi:hypothetical protein
LVSDACVEDAFAAAGEDAAPEPPEADEDLLAERADDAAA